MRDHKRVSSRPYLARLSPGLLAHLYDRGVHTRGGQFYRWVARGWVHFDDVEQPDEARRLLELRYRLSARVANEYAQAGFTAVVQDNIYGQDVLDWLSYVEAPTKHLVVLRPSVEVVAERHDERRRRTGKVAYGGTYTVAANDADLATTPRSIGLWLDTSGQTPDQTVAEIVTRTSEARIFQGQPPGPMAWPEQVPGVAARRSLPARPGAPIPPSIPG